MRSAILVNAHFDLARTEARFASARNPDIDPCDLESQAAMALWRAAEQFDPDRGVQFRTYAKAKIRGYMSNFGKRERKRRENERNAEVAILAGTDDTEDTADAVVERLSDRTLRVVQDAFRGVDRPDLKRILALRISGMSLAEIERETGLSSYKVRARFNTAREIVRAHIEEKGEDVVFPFEIEARVRK